MGMERETKIVVSDRWEREILLKNFIKELQEKLTLEKKPEHSRRIARPRNLVESLDMICLSGKPVPYLENDQIGQNWVKTSGSSALTAGKVIWIDSLKVRWEFVFSMMDLGCCCYCCCSVAQLCLTLCDLMDGSRIGFPVLHHLLELAQTHVHWGSDAFQPPHPLSSPSPPALSLPEHQSLFQWVSSSH